MWLFLSKCDCFVEIVEEDLVLGEVYAGIIKYITVLSVIFCLHIVRRIFLSRQTSTHRLHFKHFLLLSIILTFLRSFRGDKF